MVFVATGRVVVVVAGGFVKLVLVTPSSGLAPAVVREAADPAEQAASNNDPTTSRVPTVRRRRVLITRTITVEPSNLVPCLSVSAVTVC